MTPLQDNDVENAKTLYCDLSTREITYGASVAPSIVTAYEMADAQLTTSITNAYGLADTQLTTGITTAYKAANDKVKENITALGVRVTTIENADGLVVSSLTGVINALKARVAFLEGDKYKPHVYACRSFLYDGVEANVGENYNIKLCSRHSTGEGGPYKVVFQTPLSGFRAPDDNNYTIMIQPHVENGKYHFAADDVTENMEDGFSFRLSGTSTGTWDSFILRA